MTFKKRFVRMPIELKGKIREDAAIAIDEIALVYAIERTADKGTEVRIIVEQKNKTSLMLGPEYKTVDQFFDAASEQSVSPQAEASDEG